MMKTTLLAAAGALVASSTIADVHYKAVTRTEPVNQQAAMTVDAWVDDEKCDIRFTESGNPFMGEGTRIVCGEGGMLYLVNDKDKTYSEWDLDALLESVGNVMANMGGVIKMSVDNAKVQTLLDEDGGRILGYPTRHYRFKTSYDMNMAIMGMKQSQHIETVQDIWSTTALDDAALGVWLQRDPPDMGNTGLAELIELEKKKAKGWPLRTVMEQVSQDQKGRSQVTKTITEVTELSEGSAPAGTYKWGSDYQRVNMMPDLAGMQAGEQGQPQKEEEQGGWRKLLKRGGGG